MKTEERINQITKQVKILERVPCERRIDIFNRGTRNIYVIGSLLLLIGLWLIIFGESICNIGSLWSMDRGFSGNMWDMGEKLFLPLFLPCVFIIGIPLMIRNYIIKKIVEKEFPEQK